MTHFLSKLEKVVWLDGHNKKYFQLVANAGLAGESETAGRRQSCEAAAGGTSAGDPGVGAAAAAGEKEGGARIRVIRRSSRWKNKHRQANKEDNEVLVDSSEDKENSGASGMVLLHYNSQRKNACQPLSIPGTCPCTKCVNGGLV